MLNDGQIITAVEAEAELALGFRDEISRKRRILLDYYNTEPFGDEVKGRSRYVSPDVANTVEWMLPSILRVFTQGRHVGKFEADLPDNDDEANQKTELTNYVFMRQNDGTLTLYNMFKDALLQFLGVVKVAWITPKVVTEEKYSGLSQDEYDKLKGDKETEIEEFTASETLQGTIYDATVKRTTEEGKVDYLNIPGEEFLINRNARDFVDPRFIGHRTEHTTRSDLIEMGFDKEVVNALPKDGRHRRTEAKFARSKQVLGTGDNNPTTSKANDLITLLECYPKLDIDEDGIAERWQIFIAGHKVLEKKKWDQHPFAVVVPTPMPHVAIGTCPAEQAADFQLVKSVLVRNALDNIYNTNWNRMVHNERVDLDDLFTSRPGGGIGVTGEGPVQDAIFPLIQETQVAEILGAIEFMDGALETRSGVNRHNQGVDADSLNKTATGFRGMRDDSMQRIELIARLFASTGVRQIFRLTAALLSKHQDTAMQIKVTGEPMEIDPTAWRENLDVHVEVGLGTGDRNEKITNLSFILQDQAQLIASGSVLTDDAKRYNVYEKLITEIGLKDTSLYYNDPDDDQQTLMAENQQLKQMVEVMQQQANPLAEAEIIKQQGTLARVDSEQMNDMRIKILELTEKQRQFNAILQKDLTELELVHDQNVPGAAI